MPAELRTALTADAMAERYGARPADVLSWDAENLKIANIAQHYRDSEPKPKAPAAPVSRKTLKERAREASLG